MHTDIKHNKFGTALSRVTECEGEMQQLIL